MQPVQPAVDSNANYRTEFVGVSVGTEEELLGEPKIKMKKAAGPIAAVLRHDLTNEVLVEVTKDMVQDSDAVNAWYTIELRTTPTELDDHAGWQERTKAMQVAIWAVETAHGKQLAAGTYSNYRTEIVNPDHTISEQKSNQIARASRQVTVGVPAAEVGVPVGGRQPDHLHEHVQLPWHDARFVADPAAEPFTGRQLACYILLLSTILRLARTWTTLGRNVVNHVDAKNAWVVRPRTPPVTVLDTFPKHTSQALWHAVAHRDLPAWADEVTADRWLAARTHILAGAHMGGSTPPTPTINGAPAMLFEYRSTPPQQFNHTFWEYSRWTADDFS
jgi:hypothetical protein